LGDPVEVEVQKVDVLRHQIDLAVLVAEGSLAPETDPDGTVEGEDDTF
jgi:ribonuclease R